MENPKPQLLLENNNKNSICQHLWTIAKILLNGKLMELNLYKARKKPSRVSFQLKE
jgi:hypothetical protein